VSREADEGLADFYMFASWFVGLDLEECPHRLMTDVIQTGETDPAHPYTLVVVPRGTYKTSIARAAIVWKLVRQIHLFDNPYHRIVISSATLQLGKAMLQGVEGILRYGGKNQRLDEHYGRMWQNRGLTGGSKVSDGIVLAQRIQKGEIATISEPNLFIGSLRRISTGFHADEAVIDDINNKDNVRTDHQRKLTHTYWQLLFPILGTTDRAGNPTKVLMNCTPWHDDDVRGMVMREERSREIENTEYVSPWNTIHCGAINEDGTAFFPTKYSLERLGVLRANMGTVEFSANYLCDPVGDSGFVHEDQIKFKDRETFPVLQHGRICVDPNQHTDAKELGCYAAIIVAAYDRFGKMYVLDARGSREWNPIQFLDALFTVQDEFPYPIFIEDSHMGHFEHAVMMEEANRGKKLRVNYVPVDVKTTKYQRWQRLQPRFIQGSVCFSDHIAPTLKTEIKDELIRGQASRFKDFLDALAMAETGYRPRSNKDGSTVDVMKAINRQLKAPPPMTFAQAMPRMFQ